MLTFLCAAHNEQESFPVLLEEIRAVAHRMAGPYEIVIVDDGSTDGSDACLAQEARTHDDLVIARHAARRGKSAALSTGLEAARGAIVVTLDADLQNDPADVPLLLEALVGADFVCGVRARRRDRFSRRLASRFANRFRRLCLRDRFRDVGCGMQAWRSAAARRLPMFHGFHRFVPVLAEAEGFRVHEVTVSHRPRRFGKTKYDNLGRGVRGFFDLLGVAWLLRRRRGFSASGRARATETREASRSSR